MIFKLGVRWSVHLSLQAMGCFLKTASCIKCINQWMAAMHPSSCFQKVDLLGWRYCFQLLSVAALPLHKILGTILLGTISSIKILVAPVQNHRKSYTSYLYINKQVNLTRAVVELGFSDHATLYINLLSHPLGPHRKDLLTSGQI